MRFRKRYSILLLFVITGLLGAVQARAVRAAEVVLLSSFENADTPWRLLRDGAPSAQRPPLAKTASHGQRSLAIPATLPGTTGVGVAFWLPTVTEPNQAGNRPPLMAQKSWPMGHETNPRKQAPMGRWEHFTHVAADFYLPEDARGVRPLIYLKDGNLNHFQHLSRKPLDPGRWQTVKVPLTARSTAWQPQGHHKPWDGYCRQDITEFGIKVTGQKRWRGRVLIDNVRLLRQPGVLPDRNFIYNLRPNSSEIGHYRKFEISFNLARTYANPYDPDQVDVRGHFVDPNGKVETVPGFFYQGYQRRLKGGAEALTPIGRSHWKVRYAPRELGRYHFYVTVSDGQRIRTDMGSFTCVESSSPGFVRISREDPSYFEMDDGSFFYPIGHNIASVADARAEKMGVQISKSEGTYAYDRFLARMGKHGENFGRIWLTPWSFELEWTKAYQHHFAGLGRYSQHNAWRLDHVLEAAENHGIYLMLLIASHGEITTYESNFNGGKDKHGRHHPEWGSPYWTHNGGPLDSPDTFYSNDEVRRFYKQQVRYIVARWGYSTSVMAWELLNEPDLHQPFQPRGKLSGVFGRQCASFVSAMLEHAREHDPAAHLRTTNVWQHWSKHTWPVLNVEELDFYAAHLFYPNLPHYLRTHYDLIKDNSGLITLTTEADASPFPRGADVTLRYMRLTLWSSHMLPHPGSACPWWWVLIDQKDAYGQFQALAKFAEGEDRRGQNYVSLDAEVEDTAEPRRRKRKLRVVSLGNQERAFCWVYNVEAFSQQSHWTAASTGTARVTVPGLRDGRYTVEVWDTTKGKVLTSLDAQSAKNSVAFDLPEFSTDVACKILYQPAEDIPAETPAGPRPPRTDHHLPD